MKKEIKHLHAKLTIDEESKLNELLDFFKDQYTISNKSAVIRYLINKEHKAIFLNQ